MRTSRMDTFFVNLGLLCMSAVILTFEFVKMKKRIKAYDFRLKEFYTITNQLILKNNNLARILDTLVKNQKQYILEYQVVCNTAQEDMKKKSDKIEKVMKEFKAGKLHSGSKKRPVVTDPKQAVAIGYSEARKATAKLPKKK